MNSFIRSLEIDLVLDNPNEVIDIFNGIWSGLIVIEKDVYHKEGGEIIYYRLKGGVKEWIFYQDDKNDRFWCNYKKYWSLFESKFDLNYKNIQALTRILVENALNFSILSPQSSNIIPLIEVENALNCSVATPLVAMLGTQTVVYNALNRSEPR